MNYSKCNKKSNSKHSELKGHIQTDHLKKGEKIQMTNSKAEHIKRTEIGIGTHMSQYTLKQYRVISYSIYILFLIPGKKFIHQFFL